MLSREEVRFTNGTTRLAGTLTLPSTGSRYPALIALHAASEGERSFALYRHLADVMPRHGVAVLTYDRRGAGRSTGDFASASFDTLVEDACAGLEFLKSHPDIDSHRLGAWGVSQGGWLAPMLANKAKLKCLVVVSGAGVSPAQQMDYSAAFALREAGFPEPVVTVALELRRKVNAYYLGRLERQRVQDDIDRVADEPWFEFAYVTRALPDRVATSKWTLELTYDPLGDMRRVSSPTLLLYGETDPWVPVEESIEAWQAAAGRWLEVERVPQADHLMMRSTAAVPDVHDVAERYTELLVAWLTPRL